MPFDSPGERTLVEAEIAVTSASNPRETLRWSVPKGALASDAVHVDPRKSVPRFGVMRRHKAIAFSPVYLAGKRILDISGTLLLATVFSPVMAYVAIKLALSGGPVIFSHERIGKDGAKIRIYKFRTMVPDAEGVLRKLLLSEPLLREEWKRDFKLKNDPRVTPLGQFLRKTSLDELPQLWNVLKGEMSLVGPRPIVAAEVERYGRIAHYYFALKPGLTGLWQVTGRNDTDYNRRIAMDRKYTESANLWMDIKILLKTILVVLGRTGAY